METADVELQALAAALEAVAASDLGFTSKVGLLAVDADATELDESFLRVDRNPLFSGLGVLDVLAFDLTARFGCRFAPNKLTDDELVRDIVGS